MRQAHIYSEFLLLFLNIKNLYYNLISFSDQIFLKKNVDVCQFFLTLRQFFSGMPYRRVQCGAASIHSTGIGAAPAGLRRAGTPGYYRQRVKVQINSYDFPPLCLTVQFQFNPLERKMEKYPPRGDTVIHIIS